MRPLTRLLVLSLLFSLLVLAPSRALANVYTVTNTNDSGSGSLRAALIGAEIYPGSTIQFHVPSGSLSSGVAYFKPQSPLPQIILDGTIVDGSTQTSFAGNTNTQGPEVFISGTLSSQNAVGNGLTINNAAHCLVKGLTLNHFSTQAGPAGSECSEIPITGSNAAYNHVEGCYIGTSYLGNAVPSGPVATAGITIKNGAHNNVIGGTTAAAHNVVSGNGQWEIRLEGSSTASNVVEGNYIGTNNVGTAALALPSADGAILIASGAHDNRIGGTSLGARNDIVGGFASVRIEDGTTTANKVQGNYIGINVTGTARLSNSNHYFYVGVLIDSGAHGNTIGGGLSGVANVISGFRDNAVELTGSGTKDNLVAGNFIGTAGDLLTAIPNGYGSSEPGAAVLITDGASQNTIGGGGFARNYIAGNSGDGIDIVGDLNKGTGSNGNVVKGNYIGLNHAGNELGNKGHGVVIYVYATSNTIGGTATGEANHIAYNGGDGVFVSDLICGGWGICAGIPNRNVIRGNDIFQNDGLGINLFAESTDSTVTPNDKGDGDDGPNALQNFPVISLATYSNGTTYIKGTLNSRPNADYAIDLFRSSSRDPSGYGEGGLYVASKTVTTNGAGDATFTFDLSGDFTGKIFTSTATRLVSGNPNTTSEFGNAVKAVAKGFIVYIVPDRFSENAGANAAIGVVYRNTVDNSAAVTVTLASSRTSDVTVPATVTIASGGTGVLFPVAAHNNTIVDGSRTAKITASATGYTSDSATVTVTDDESHLTVAVTPSSFSETAGANAATGTVTRNGSTAADLKVTLASSDTTAAKVPASVTILAGQASATFAVRAVDDTVADGPQSATIRASNPDYLGGTATVTATDDEVKTLTMTVTPNSFSESAGANAVTATVTRNTPTTVAQTVNLSSGDPSEAVPASATVTIPIGQASATFKINAVSDAVVDGPQSVVLIASATGFTSGTATVTVTDDDVPTLTLSVTPGIFSEAGGASAATGKVTRNTDTSADLVVTLASNDATEATMPPTVTILAGATSRSFTVHAIDDTIADGSQSVVLSASASGFTTGTAVVTVTDNETAAPDAAPSE